MAWTDTARRQHMCDGAGHPSDLRDGERALIEPMFFAARKPNDQHISRSAGWKNADWRKARILLIRASARSSIKFVTTAEVHALASSILKNTGDEPIGPRAFAIGPSDNKRGSHRCEGPAVKSRAITTP